MATLQRCWKAVGKNTTTVGPADLNSDFKDLDVATERHLRRVLSATSGRPRADVAYCIGALARRLSKTNN